MRANISSFIAKSIYFIAMIPSMQISLILADDHPIVLEGIQAHLKKDSRFNIIAAVSNGLELLQSEQLLSTDLILMDLNMPGLDGLKTLDELKARGVKAKIIILTNYHSSELIKDCRLKGASGYMVKSDQLPLLEETILKVMAGKQIFPTLEEKEANSSFSFFDDFLKKYKLTKREVEIIRLVCQNLKTKAIADRLYLSEFTIHTHRKNIMRKLEIGDSTLALYDFALKNNLIAN
ncbi:response regulator transcription factor [Pedobacter sp. MC2016-14]|uniref:response regulator transcription factor n=1 Tax=Pedobacter sp. MC2016-14 TaxID=2897327 RepID=UPI001E2B5458|nr:response regulator transcription factor [Pedobacter sp. MC2016-14]MCD0488163.1 response regulator transcription factor [Pedobacter sp. MC2016-14]